MAIGAFWFSLMALLVKLAGQRLPAMQIIVFRSIITLGISFTAVLRAGVRPVLGTHRRLLFVRGLLGSLGLLGFYHSLVYNPLGEANLLQYTNPIFAILLAGMWLGERIGRAEILSVALSLLGVVCITRPAAIFGSAASALDPRYVAIGLVGAACSGSAYAVVRKIGAREHPAVVVLYLPLVATPLSLALSRGSWRMPSAVDWALLVGAAATTQIAQTYMTRGLQLESAARATTTGYLQIVFAGLWGVLVLGERLSPWTLLGAGLIVGSAVSLAFSKGEGGVGDE